MSNPISRNYLGSLLLILLTSFGVLAQDSGLNLPNCDPSQYLVKKACGKNSAEICFSCAFCGDGDVDRDYKEECDLGSANSAEGECRSCKDPFCGDGIHNEFDEQINPKWTCDFESDSSCRTDCTKCGDNKINHSSEECDGDAKPEGSFCRSNCKLAYCGDGIVDVEAGETCEPSLDTTCRDNCTRCGDKQTQVGFEECDEGTETKKCSVNCLLNDFCDVYRLEFFQESGQLTIGTDYEQLGCLVEKINEWGGNAIQLRGGGNRLDDQLWPKFRDFLELKAAEHYCNSLSIDKESSEYEQCLENERYGYLTLRRRYQNEIKNKAYYKSDTFFDENCNYLKPSEAQGLKVCGVITHGYLGSPVSLELFEGAYEQAEWKLVSFALNPKRGQEVAIWKAGVNLPLLIWDPNDTNIVTSGAQLFGNYFNPGEVLGSAKTVSYTPERKDSADYLWSNGYEALASLDKDGNGFLDNEDELRGIKLWFDKNSNAKAEADEIRPLKDLGIARLSTSYDFEDDSGSLISQKGYYTAGDSVNFGRSIDWYTNSFKSFDAAIKYLKSLNGGAEEQESLKDIELKAKNNKFNGAWLWEATDLDLYNKSAYGVLFLDSEDGDLTGVSVVEELLAPNDQGLKAKLNQMEITGKLVNENEIKLEVDTPGHKTISFASLSIDGKELKGRSEVVIEDATGSKQSRTVVYNWTARKIAN